MSRKILISIVMALALFGVPFDGIAQSIKVGAVVPLTGRYAALGGQVKTGYEIAVQQINAAGGVPVGGKKLQIELTHVGRRVGSDQNRGSTGDSRDPGCRGVSWAGRAPIFTPPPLRSAIKIKFPTSASPSRFMAFTSRACVISSRLSQNLPT